MIRELQLKAILTQDRGLQPAHLRDLGRVVVLAGPNGAGKSRYLLLAFAVAGSQGERASPNTASTSRAEASRLRELVANGTLLRDEAKQKLTLEQAAVYEAQAERAQAHVDALLREDREELARHQTPAVLLWRPSQDPVQPRQGLTQADAANLVAAARSQPGFTKAYPAIDVYCATMARALLNERIPVEGDRPDVKEAARQAREFNTILEKLVRKTLTPVFEDDGHVGAALNGRRLDPDELSEGERVLVGWSILLHAQATSLKDAIVCIDEPENHLHPDICIEAIRRLEGIVAEGTGQIWITTHALPLIAAFSLSSTYLVDQGRIVFGGNCAGDIIKGLLGGAQNHRSLQQLLGDADDLAFSNFAAQCLLDAHVARHRIDDRQENLFRDRIAAKLRPGGTLRILDYGAGRGRMATAIAELLRSHPIDGAQLVYVAYNPADEDQEIHSECDRSVKGLAEVSNVSTRYARQILDVQPPSDTAFDLVLLCNVLHEVPLEEWRVVLESVHRCLKDEGEAIVMEDQLISVGELPHPKGFLVLDLYAMRALFRASREELPDVMAGSGDRLSMIEIPRPVLGRFGELRWLEALRLVSERALREAEALRRAGDSSWQAGRRHAFYAMLLLNARLCENHLVQA